ncbi:hypothetical protein [Bacillus infantis]|uniref:Radical SAM protein n=1 Tax=Bacillus infantis TaxID=324767 RepID=A0A5D4R1Z7_9BACI|nr:hypothetical protein [Bacillus infantis]TYS45383.1 hypothetical protein FZD51_20000 [Bacillus infantis]
MEDVFILDKRMGIAVPVLDGEWEEYPQEDRQEILYIWEKIRGGIPDRISELETQINRRQDRLADEENFELSCKLNSEIADLASIINDLWLWYRANQEIGGKLHR